MAKGLAILFVAGASLAGAEAGAQSAGQALQNILFQGAGGGGALSENRTRAVQALLLGETTTFPIGSSAGGFAWTFSPDLRVPVRRSRSFGPMFAERPFTVGARKLNVGAAFQHTRFDAVGGQPLTDLIDSVSYNFNESFYNYSSSVAVTIDRTIFSATYGVHDRVDIGVIVPVGEARVSGFSGFSFNDEFDGLRSGRTSQSGSSFGMGDVVVRLKAAVTTTGRFDSAVALDVRLPTGDRDKLLGTGTTQAKAQFIAASTFGRATPHVNIGYTFGGAGMRFGSDTRWEGSSGDPELLSAPEASQEFTYTAGADIVATPRLTVAGDVLGRLVKDSANMSLFDSGASDPDRVVFLQITPGTVHLLLGAIGAKFSVGGSWLATGTLLFPLNDNGIKPGVTPIVGFERAF
jgi:hypothetical protein